MQGARVTVSIRLPLATDGADVVIVIGDVQNCGEPSLGRIALSLIASAKEFFCIVYVDNFIIEQPFLAPSTAKHRP